MICQPCSEYDKLGSMKSMPVSYAILNSANRLPPDDPADALVVPEVVDESPEPPPPQALTRRPNPTMNETRVNDRRGRELLINVYLLALGPSDMPVGMAPETVAQSHLSERPALRFRMAPTEILMTA